MKAICTFLFLCVFLTSSTASVINWTGDGGTTNWTNPDNWDTDQIPSVSDSVFTFYGDVINIPVGYSVEIAYFKLLGDLAINPSADLIINGTFDALGDVINFGTITIDGSSQDGLFFSTQAADVEFDNHGHIDINNATTYGFKTGNGQIFTNHDWGTIEVTNSGAENFINEGIFHNYGELTVKNSDIDIGILIAESNSGNQFTNHACGRVFVVDQIELTDDTLTNHGFFSQNYDGDNNINSSLSRLENFGVIEDRKSSFISSDFDVQSIWIKKYEGYQPKTGEDISIFAAIDATGFTYSDLYTDKLLTENAGSFSSNNIWIPNTNANGKSTFYVSVTIDADNCSDTIRIDLEFPVLEVNYWVGGIGNWNMASNWSTGAIPTENDIVSIYNQSDSLFIPLVTNAKAKQIISRGKIGIGPVARLDIIGDNIEDGLNVTNGKIIIDGTLQIKNFERSIFLDNSTLVNSGTITCNNAETNLHSINSPISNLGDINLKSAQIGMYTSGQFISNLGNINCEDISLCIQMSSSTDSLTNDGLIQNDSGDLISASNSTIINNNSIVGKNPMSSSISSQDFQNYGTVEIIGDSNQHFGIDGNIYNAPNATIVTKHLERGLDIEGENLGTITTDSCTYAMYVKDDFTNREGGTLTISNSETGLYLSDGDFFNELGGTVSIVENLQYGLYIEFFQSSSLSATNEGMITIDQTDGVGMYCGRLITNQSSGKIDILNSSDHGIHLFAGIGYFVNKDSASLKINNSLGHGMYLEGSIFYNEDSAVLEIDSALMSGIYITSYIDFFFETYGKLDNDNKVIIGKKTLQNGLHVNTDCTISNSECHGEIINKSSIESHGNFNNFGIYHHLNATANTITNDIQNDGVIYDPLETISSTNINNDGFYFDVKEGVFNEGETIINTIHYDDDITTGFEIDTVWYVDPLLTIEGGKYDLEQNTFFIYGLAADSSQFYFKVQNTSCTPSILDTFSLHLEFPINKICGQVTWEGNTGSWINPTNWNLYRLPSTCDSVMILNPLDSVLINTTDSLIVEHVYNEGLLFLTSNGNLTIRNASGNGILNKGQITNNGSLAIEEVDFNGYLGDQNSELINNGNFMIQDILKKGIILNGGSIQNKAAGVMTLQNITQEDFKLNPGSTFLLQGLLNIED